jgi:cation diffusion facilitator family transporter
VMEEIVDREHRAAAARLREVIATYERQKELILLGAYRRGSDEATDYALAGYTSGVLLALVALWMVKEGVEHLITHPAVDYRDALPVAGVGLAVNIVSAYLLSRGHHYGHSHPGHSHHEPSGNGHVRHRHHHDGDHDHDHDHGHGADRDPGHDHAAGPGKPTPGSLDFNLRAAYIHILADAMTSLLAIGALSLGIWADLWFLDPLTGLVGGGVIVWWAVSLCRQASRQLLDVVSSPRHEKLVRQRLEAIDDVQVADLHVWELGPGRRSCIVSVVTARPRDVTAYRDAVLSALDVAHLTIEIHQCGRAHDPSPVEADDHDVAACTAPR